MRKTWITAWVTWFKEWNAVGPGFCITKKDGLHDDVSRLVRLDDPPD